MQVGDLVKCAPTLPDGRELAVNLRSMMGLVVYVNENPPAGLDPLPYRVHWINPPDGHPAIQSLKGKMLRLANKSA